MKEQSRNRWTPEFYQSIKDWMAKEDKTLEQAKEHFNFGSNSWYAAKAKWGAAKLQKRTYTKKPAFVDIETQSTPKGQVAILIVPIDQVKTIVGSLWQS